MTLFINVLNFKNQEYALILRTVPQYNISA